MSKFHEGQIVEVSILKGGYWQDTRTGTFVKQTSEFRATVMLGGKKKSYSIYNIQAKR
ncbi:hypothetical protein [Vibrio sp. D431a]|uniref:hypothetical protein n=1 Tax=Vibrio sp. D431a TaxID=2837388 RepID=UPI002552BD1B|nr:hypothetical protein [Vibrio sp. D431a]MDK9793787.1 hypothetical protein [Vibrio sp. D431a]